MHIIKKIERHIVLYIDEYHINDDDIKTHGSIENILNDEEELEQFKVDTSVDDISNRKGDFETQWFLNGKEI